MQQGVVWLGDERDRGATGAGTMGVRRNKRSRGTRAGAITTDARGSAQAASRLQGDVQRDARTMGARAGAYKMAYGAGLELRASLVGGPSEASTPKKKN